MVCFFSATSFTQDTLWLFATYTTEWMNKEAEKLPVEASLKHFTENVSHARHVKAALQ